VEKVLGGWRGMSGGGESRVMLGGSLEPLGWLTVNYRHIRISTVDNQHMYEMLGIYLEAPYVDVNDEIVSIQREESTYIYTSLLTANDMMHNKRALVTSKS